MDPVLLARPVEVLLVEDDPGDVELTQRGLSRAKVLVNLHVVSDGQQAMAYLHQQGAYADALLPDLILLDLNLPLMDGREVLKEIKVDARLKQVPVVVMTTSDADSDIVRSYGLGANCYVTKPIGLDQFVAVVNAIDDFWLSVVRLPTRVTP